ncbi:MAG: hypothetical protein R3B07_08675 [Polyangiaceae bacterium]
MGKSGEKSGESKGSARKDASADLTADKPKKTKAPKADAKAAPSKSGAAKAAVKATAGSKASPKSKLAAAEPSKRATRTDAMQLTRATRVAFTALLIVNLASAAAAIGLLGRMRPAIERIIERNIYSLEAVEGMLVVLSSPDGATNTNQAALDDALIRAERNITGDAERPLIAQLRTRLPQALKGDVAARRESLKALQELADVNRKDIEAADQNAKRLGTAGAWAVSFLALVGLGSGLIGLRRFDRRVLAPLEELHSVLTDHSGGQRLRRCGAIGQASKELHETMLSLNQLLDSRADESLRRIAIGQKAGDGEHQSLLAVLDLIPEPTWLVDDQGSILAANRPALDRIAAEPELARAVKQLAIGESEPSDEGLVKRLRRTAVDGGSRALFQLASA